MERGRPSKYNPDFCDRIIALGKEGKAIVHMAAEFDVHKDTIYEWAKVYPDFSDALSRALVHSEAFWADIGYNNLVSPKGETFNSAVYKLHMANRFDWRDKSDDRTDKQQSYENNLRMLEHGEQG